MSLLGGGPNLDLVGDDGAMLRAARASITLAIGMNSPETIRL